MEGCVIITKCKQQCPIPESICQKIDGGRDVNRLLSRPKYIAREVRREDAERRPPHEGITVQPCTRVSFHPPPLRSLLPPLYICFIVYHLFRRSSRSVVPSPAMNIWLFWEILQN